MSQPGATDRAQRWAAIAIGAAPVIATLGILGVYLVTALVIHPGTPQPSCSVDGLDRLTHWDGAWYVGIADHGYLRDPGLGQQGAYLPLFPAMATVLHSIVPPLRIEAAGLVINIAATCVAMLLVDRIVASWPQWQRLGLVIFLLSLPGAFFYIAFYSEAVFVAALALTMWASLRAERTRFAPLGIALAGADRVLGIVLVVPFAVTLWLRGRRPSWATASLIAPCFAGVLAIAAYILVTGAVHPFFSAHHDPGYLTRLGRHGVASGVRLVGTVASFGRLDGELPVVADSAIPGLGFYECLLMVPLLWAAWRYDRTIGLFALTLGVLTLLTGPVISEVRYLAVVLPAWIGGVALVRRWRLGWVAVAVASIAGLIANLFMVTEFINCRWAG